MAVYRDRQEAGTVMNTAEADKAVFLLQSKQQYRVACLNGYHEVPKTLPSKGRSYEYEIKLNIFEFFENRIMRYS